MAYGSIYTQVHYSLQSPLLTFCHTLYPWPLLPFTLLPYPLTLHYSLYPFCNPCSYTQSLTSPCFFPYTSYASPTDATQVLTLVYSYKIEKERAVAYCLFFMPENPYSGSCNPVHRQSLTGQLTWAHYTRIILDSGQTLNKHLRIDS